MNCFVCDLEKKTGTAIAVCQRCGGGACTLHVRERYYAATPAGMAPAQPPRRELLCVDCFDMSEAVGSSTASSRKG